MHDVNDSRLASVPQGGQHLDSSVLSWKGVGEEEAGVPSAESPFIAGRQSTRREGDAPPLVDMEF